MNYAPLLHLRRRRGAFNTDFFIAPVEGFCSESSFFLFTQVVAMRMRADAAQERLRPSNPPQAEKMLFWYSGNFSRLNAEFSTSIWNTSHQEGSNYLTNKI